MGISIISDLLFPPGCIGCRRRFNIFDNEFREDVAFCPECRAAWEREKLESCPTCGVAAVDCTCCPPLIKRKYVDCISLVKFGRTLAADRLIYTLKRKKHERGFEFASEELAKRLMAYCRRYNTELSGAVITNVPRKKKSVAAYGFDHGRELAERVADFLGYKYDELILRVGNSKDQKKLSHSERRQNVFGQFALAQNKELEGKTVVLVDDVVTTGNTAYECMKVLRLGGAKKVVLLSIARTPEKKVSRRRAKHRKKAENSEKTD